MRYASPKGDELERLEKDLEPVVRGLGMDLVEAALFRGRRSVQVRLVVYKKGAVGIEDCAAAHRALLPRLETAFPEQDLSVEVTSPGIDRTIKDGAEASRYLGRGVKCYPVDGSGWIGGILTKADPAGLTLMAGGAEKSLTYDQIAKAKLDYSQEV